MEKSRWRSWKFLARAKTKAVDLTLNATIEHVPLNSNNVRRRSSFLFRFPRVFIAMKLENNESEQIKTSKKPSIIRFFTKVFGHRGMLRRIRANVGSRKISKHSKPHHVDLTLNATIEHVPLNSNNVRRRFSFLPRFPRVFTAMKLENNESEQIKTSIKPSIIRFFTKVFGHRGMLWRIRANVGSRKISKPSKPHLGFSEVDGILSSLKVLFSEISASKYSWRIWSTIFILLLLFLCEKNVSDDSQDLEKCRSQKFWMVGDLINSDAASSLGLTDL